MQSCQVIEGVNPHKLRKEIAPANRPAVFRGLARHWPVVASGLGSSEDLAHYLKTFSTKARVDYIIAEPEVRGDFFFGETLKSRNFQKEQASIDDILDRLLALAGQASPPNLFIQSLSANDILPGFSAENSIPWFPAHVPPRVWIGNGARVQTHFDLADNVAVAVAGRRRFTLFPPEQLANLYVGPFHETLAGVPVSIADIEAPDFERFPRLAEALACAEVADLEPGDAVFIPYGWWHHVRSTGGLAMLVNFWWNDGPAHLKSQWGTLYLAMLTVRDLPERYREVWQNLFSHYVFKADGEPGAHLRPEDRGLMRPFNPSDFHRALDKVLRDLAQHK